MKHDNYTSNTGNAAIPENEESATKSEATSPSDMIKKLARLSEVDYLSARKEAAKLLNVPVVKLDKAVNNERQKIRLEDQSRATLSCEKEVIDTVRKFNVNNKLILEGGKAAILHIGLEDEDISYNSIAGMRDVHKKPEDLVCVGFKNDGKPDMQSIVDAWIKHEEGEVFKEGLIFYPDKNYCNPHKYNLYSGWGVGRRCLSDASPDQAQKLSIIHSHIRDVICSGDEACNEYLLNWVAYTMQNLSSMGMVIPVLRGNEGIGKGVFTDFIRNIWGKRHSIVVYQSEHLTGHFNSRLEGKLFVVANEAIFAGDKVSENALKVITTDDTFSIERKFFEAYVQKNFLKLIITTNAKHAIPASSTSRRYFVLDVSDCKRGNTEYFNDLWRAFNDEAVQGLFLDEMLSKNLSGFVVTQYPETTALTEQRILSLGSFDNWMLDYIVAGGPAFADFAPVWPSMPGTSELYENYMEWCKKHKKSQYEILKLTSFGTGLGEMFFKNRTTDDDNKDRRMRIHWGGEKDALKSFCEKCGLNFEVMHAKCHWYQ